MFTSIVIAQEKKLRKLGKREIRLIHLRKKSLLQDLLQRKSYRYILSVYEGSSLMFNCNLSQAAESEVGKEIEEAIKFAENSPVPDKKELYTTIYCDSDGLPVRGCDPFTWGVHRPRAAQAGGTS